MIPKNLDILSLHRVKLNWSNVPRLLAVVKAEKVVIYLTFFLALQHLSTFRHSSLINLMQRENSQLWIVNKVEQRGWFFLQKSYHKVRRMQHLALAMHFQVSLSVLWGFWRASFKITIFVHCTLYIFRLLL